MGSVNLESFVKEQDRVERKIKLGRWCLLILVPANVIFFATFTHLSYSDYGPDERNKVMN